MTLFMQSILIVGCGRTGHGCSVTRRYGKHCFTAENAEGAEKRYGVHGRARRTLRDLGGLCGEGSSGFLGEASPGN